MFSNLKDLYKLKKQASELKSKLAQEQISSENNGIKITMNGNQEVIEVIINPSLSKQDQEKYLQQTFNDCISKIQQLMARQMMGNM